MCLALFLAHPRPADTTRLHSHFTVFPESERFKEQTARESEALKDEEVRMNRAPVLHSSLRDESLADERSSVGGKTPASNARAPMAVEAAAPKAERPPQRGAQRSLNAVLDGDSDGGEAEYGESGAASPSAPPSPPEVEDVVECFCGEELSHGSDQFVCCDRCNTWQHWRCVSFFPSSTSDSEEYVCPTCSAAAPPLPIKATLVCCPDVILGQWREEIERHCVRHRLKVLVYSGVKRTTDTSTAGNAVEKMRRQEEKRRRKEELEEKERAESADAMVDAASPGMSPTVSSPSTPSAGREQSSPLASPPSAKSSEAPVSYRIVRPSQLADYDVILTTYSVLRSDLYHAPTSATSGSSRPLRQRKRYRVMPSPLPSVQYWRVVLDESQMMGEGTANCAQMCLLLPAVNRWGVSGTVISKGLDDLYGLLLFLQQLPYSERRYWDGFLSLPYQRRHPLARQKLHAIVRRLMWRNTKDSVRGELGPAPSPVAPPLPRLHARRALLLRAA